MIKEKSIAKFFAITILLLIISSSIFAADLSLGVHYDNYNSEGKNTFGGSASLTEYLSDEFSIKAVVENKKNNNYFAYCGCGYEGKFINILGGFLFDLRNSIFSPGIILNADITVFNFITLGANTNFIVSTKNIFENYITEVEGFLTFHCKNQDVSLILDYSQTALLSDSTTEDSTKQKDFSVGGYLDVLALDERSPFKIGMFFGVESYKKTYDGSFFTLDVNVGGRFIFNLEKFGFTINGESTVFKVGEEQKKIPFALSLTTRFAL